MPLDIIRNDITKVRADAIVNTANPRVAVGAGTDQAIYEAAGKQQLLSERAKIGNMTPGQAAYTPAFALDAKYIIHTVGPAWRGGGYGEREAVASCYKNCLAIAEELGCETVAFPLLSTGTYGFPKDEALRIAIDEISSFLFAHDMTVLLVVYDRESFVISGKVFANVRSYIEEHEVKKRPLLLRDRSLGRRREAEAAGADHAQIYNMPVSGLYERREEAREAYEEAELRMSVNASYKELTIDDIIGMKEDTFQQVLFRIIDRKGLTDPEVYKRSNIDRKLFSKIRSDVDYTPSKRTVMALIIGLELNLDEASDLLNRAGYSFSPADLSDLTVRACIEQNMYNIHMINCYLFDLGQKTLGA